MAPAASFSSFWLTTISSASSPSGRTARTPRVRPGSRSRTCATAKRKGAASGSIARRCHGHGAMRRARLSALSASTQLPPQVSRTDLRGRERGPTLQSAVVAVRASNDVDHVNGSHAEDHREKAEEILGHCGPRENGDHEKPTPIPRMRNACPRICWYCSGKICSVLSRGSSDVPPAGFCSIERRA
jgi:hypothetical protein